MIIPGSANALLLDASAGGYQISRSLRFRSSASANLTRTPATGTNRTTWTWSGWVKRGLIDANYRRLFDAAVGSVLSLIRFNPSYQIEYWDYNTSTSTVVNNITTTQVFRDPSAWYHIVVSVDTTQATAANRVRLYVNGTQITALATASYPAQNYQTAINSAAQHAICGPEYFDGYLAEVNFIDGQALTPSSFGETDATTGVWKPKAYTGTYGTNGFYLKFADNSGATATTIGKDSSGNGNNWTPNNISVTAGVTYDSMIDTPTPYDDGTAYGVGNYCVMNPLLAGTSNTYANANLFVSIPAGTTLGSNVAGSIGATSGKWYYEATFYTSGTYANAPALGVTNDINSANAGGTSGIRTYTANGQKYDGTTASAYGSSYTNNDVIGVALDIDSGTITFYKNNVSQGTAFTGLSGTYYPYARIVREPSFSSGYYFNFGQRPFTYTPPSGFKALNTQNLPTPTIAAGNAYMDATIYSGNSSLQNVANAAGFQPDFVWIKNRSSATDHILSDSVRGAGNYLISNLTNAQATNTIIFAAFNSNGFQVNNAAQTNSSGSNYVGWQWKENVSAGFDIVTYVGNGVARNIAHNLGVPPKFMIVKQLNTVTNWPIFHTSMGGSNYMYLNTTGAQVTDTTYWNGSAPASSVFTVGTNGQTNFNGYTYIAYLFADVAGYSAFGSYTGNGSADGPFVYTGFRPRYILIKRTDTTDSWVIEDTARNPYNVDTQYLLADTSGAEGNVTLRDILSNGFKPRATAQNASGGTYIYAAFAENPMKYSLAR